MENIIKYILAFIIAYCTPIIPLMIIIGGFVCVDTYFGIKAAKSKNIPICSRRFSRIIDKSIKYTFALLLFHGINVYIMKGLVFTILGLSLTLTTAIASIIIFIELFSIDEKLRRINGQGFKFHLKKFLKLIKQYKVIKKDLTEDNEDGKDTNND